MVDHVLALPEDTRLMVLAPVVAGRKGRAGRAARGAASAQGFVRVRVDGKVFELDAAPRLAKQGKHTVEVVVDRLKVRADATSGYRRVVRDRAAPRQRARARRGDGQRPRARVLGELRLPGVQLLAARARAAAVLVQQPDAGACPRCDGLGTVEFFDPARVVAHPNLSAGERRDPGWDRRNQFYHSMLAALAAHYGFDLETPWEALSPTRRRARPARLGRRADRVPLPGRARPHHRAAHAFEGVLPNFERRYRETESAAVREELAKYRNTRACPDCGGTRLRREALHVLVAGRRIHEVSAWPLRRSLEFFGALELPGAQAAVAGKIVTEIASRLRFLVNVGLDYLSLDRAAQSLSGGEAQRIRLASQIGSGLTGVLYVLDEPSIGLHQRDNARLLETLKHLRDLGNSVIVVEHDAEAILAADHVVDMGPGRARRRPDRGRGPAGDPPHVSRRLPASTFRRLRSRIPRQRQPPKEAVRCASRGERKQPQA
jgi:excinuclease ABC subunit A